MPLTRLVTLLFILVPWAAAQFPSPPPAAEVTARRERLAEKLEKGIAFIAGAQRSTGYSEFRQSNDFYYLTGLEIPDCYLVLDVQAKKSVLFVPARGYSDAIEGAQYESLEAVKAQSGVDEVRIFKAKGALEELDGLLGKATLIYTPTDPEEIGGEIMDSARPEYKQREKHPWERFTMRETGISKLIAERFPKAEVKNLSGHVRTLRVIKSAHEIELLRKASAISVNAMIETIKACKPGRYEYELGAVNDFHSKLMGAQGPAYFPIVGSGPNSCVVHYWRKNRRIEDGDMLVVDAGCSYGYYVTDITRAFPANGRFTAEQKRVYNAVLEAQTKCIEEAKPGVPLSQLQGLATKILKKHELDRYFTHGLSHHVGMAVHDPGSYFGKLEVGHVITIEPGAYLSEKALGVRIEDVIVITENGCEVITKGCPKTVEEIEALMAGGR